MTIKLVNARLRREQYPGKFETVPKKRIAECVPVLSFVKLSFISPDPNWPNERMWCRIESIKRDGEWTATMDSIAMNPQQPGRGVVVRFREQHIFDVLHSHEIDFSPPTRRLPVAASSNTVSD